MASDVSLHGLLPPLFLDYCKGDFVVRRMSWNKAPHLMYLIVEEYLTYGRYLINNYCNN
jgi:hypothetical protein